MPRDAIITYDQVAAAAAALVDEGIKPTTRTLRERLGNVGSMQTVLRLLQNWKASQSELRDADNALPSSVQQAVLNHIAKCTEAAKASLSAELADQQKELEGLALENDRLASMVEERSNTMEELKASKAMAEGQVAHLTEELRGVLTELGEAREANHLLRIEQARSSMQCDAMRKLEAELASYRQLYELERHARVASEQSLAVALALKADLECRLSRSESHTPAARKSAPRRAKAST